VARSAARHPARPQSGRFFIKAFEINRHVPFSCFSLLAVLALIDGYYVISTFVFPQDSSEWPAFDSYYPTMKRPVVGGMVIINGIIGAYMVALVSSGAGLAQVSSRHPSSGHLEAGFQLAFLAAIAGSSAPTCGCSASPSRYFAPMRCGRSPSAARLRRAQQEARKASRGALPCRERAPRNAPPFRCAPAVHARPAS
jgi:hypothetical protein